MHRNNLSMQTTEWWMNSQTRTHGQEPHNALPEHGLEKKECSPNRSKNAVVDDISISRWTGPENVTRCTDTAIRSDHYVIGIALVATRAKLVRGSQTVFEGSIPAGMVHVSAPSKELAIQFHTSFDILHFHVSADYFRALLSNLPSDPIDRFSGFVNFRSPFAEQLARTLLKQADTADRMFAHCIGQTLVLHIARLDFPQNKVGALPKWRLRRVEEYVRTHIESRVRLSDLAKAAGLSRMYFAAQFRAATGYRPCEYVLNQRIEYAKSILSKTGMPLAEVALTVGFCTQAHFSTVFKRVTGETPAGWRYARKVELVLLQRVPAVAEVGGDRFKACHEGSRA